MPYVIAGLIAIVVAAVFLLTRTPSNPVDETQTATETATSTEAADTPNGAPASTSSDLTPAVDVTDPSLTPVGVDIPEEVSMDAETKTFIADAVYFTPNRTAHNITVSMTLSGDTVTDTDVLYNGETSPSTPSHSGFDSAYADEVIGKDISEVNLSRVGGASLTSAAFNDAVSDIRAQL